MELQSVQRKFFAVLPAAGHSRRMGEFHKLLLPWRETTVMGTVIENWANSGASKLFVVVRQDDSELQAECRRIGRCTLVIPTENPADMKESIRSAVRHIEQHECPTDVDRCLIAPADLPTLTPSIINRVITASCATDAMVAPLFGDRSGHPVCLPWRTTSKLFQLTQHQGLDHLIRTGPVEMFSLPINQRPEDIDTPEDYRRLAGKPPEARGPVA